MRQFATSGDEDLQNNSRPDCSAKVSHEYRDPESLTGFGSWSTGM